MAISNIGSQDAVHRARGAHPDDLPRRHVGDAAAVARTSKLLGSFEFSHPPDNSERMNVGAEYAFRSTCSCAAATTSTTTPRAWPRASGFHFPVSVAGMADLDYAYTDMKDLGSSTASRSSSCSEPPSRRLLRRRMTRPIVHGALPSGARRGALARGAGRWLAGARRDRRRAPPKQVGPAAVAGRRPARLHRGRGLVPDSSGITLEVYLRLPPATLPSSARDGAATSQVRVALKCAAGLGSRAHEATQDVRDRASRTRRAGRARSCDALPGRARALQARGPARGPEPAQARARLSEHARYSPSIAGRAGGARSRRPRVTSPTSSSRGRLGTARRGPRVRTRRRGYASRTRTASTDSTPPSFETAFTARARAGDQRPWRWVARVLDAKGQVVAQQESTSAAGVVAHGSARFDIAHRAGGPLHARTRRRGRRATPARCERRAKFSIGWGSDTWNRERRRHRRRRALPARGRRRGASSL